MLEFIQQYWLETLFTLLAGGLVWAVKTSLQSTQDKFTRSIEEMMKKFVEDSENKRIEEDRKINARLDTLSTEMATLKTGVLSQQKQILIDECHKLLDRKEVISTDEYDHLLHMHIAYKALGGNDKGDEWFNLVREKYLKELKKSEK